MTFDEIDLAILRALSRRGRISFRELASEVNLSANATTERVRRLIGKKVIRGFYADLDLGQLGLMVQAYIDVKLIAGAHAKKFETAISTVESVVRIEILTGTFDLRIKVACRDQEDLIRTIEEIRSKGGVHETNSVLICRSVDASGARF
jgi:DNA-binding Lrp family transcriptional regulator